MNDSGAGIEPEFLPLVFDRFRQSDSGTGRTHGGLGLGLAIAKQLVEAHKGRISAESAGKGCGSTFTVQLTIATQGAGDIADDAHAIPGWPGESEPRLDGTACLSSTTRRMRAAS